MTVRFSAGRRLPLVVAAVGVILLAAAAVLAAGNTPAPTDAGALPAVATMAATPRPPEPRSTATTGTAGVPASAGAPSDRLTSQHSPVLIRPVAGGATTTAAAATSALGSPAVLHLPTLHRNATVEPVGSVHGVLQVPDDISRVGWWQHSAAPGSTAGSTVIDGHIDSAAAGEGALFHLADLNPGDPLSVTNSTGTTTRYQVSARRVYVKEHGLPADLFNQQGPGRLVIISCGGPFDSSTRSYQDNIAVFATPTT